MDAITILTNLLQDNQYVAIVTAVVTIFSTLAAVTPTPKEGTLRAKFYKIVDFLAVNVGRAKDK